MDRTSNNCELLEYIYELCEIMHSPYEPITVCFGEEQYEDVECIVNQELGNVSPFKPEAVFAKCYTRVEKLEINTYAPVKGPFIFPQIFLKRWNGKDIFKSNDKRQYIVERYLGEKDNLLESLNEYALDYKKYFMLSMYIMDYVNSLYFENKVVDNDTKDKDSGHAESLCEEIINMLDFICSAEGKIKIEIGKGRGKTKCFRNDGLKYLFKKGLKHRKLLHIAASRMANVLGVNPTLLNARSTTWTPELLSHTDKNSAFRGIMKQFLEYKKIKNNDKLIGQTLWAIGMSEDNGYRDGQRIRKNGKPTFQPLSDDTNNDIFRKFYKSQSIEGLKNLIYNVEQ